MSVYSYIFFTYEIALDVDGKQARRTGTSSALGLDNQPIKLLRDKLTIITCF